MKIINNNPFISMDAYTRNVGPKKRVEGSSEKGAQESRALEDKVILSPMVREIQEAKETLESDPDVRKAKVARIREQIEAGTYTVDARILASKMVRDSLIESLD